MKKREVKPTLDLRYPSSPSCDCNLSAAIRVVESSRKPSKGKLFYCCPHQRCRFFGWCVPKIATWAPDGFPVRYPNEGDDSLIYADGREYNEVEKEACYEDEILIISMYTIKSLSTATPTICQKEHNTT
ncbi:hypothetical protein CDL12_03416 [Handroanthus impetiginosus]|uniref:GRF-type domain-containing protein n=1 Tax=Handroanthus impetiginosus TaxID=429701 RepID=A0A2G9I274_9LAMI|nr:hypothetical protein CDL12_03416 [Handroanthus impetiginosus]